MNKKNKKNKGFSLVELIIVIAIMAILAGVMVPQFIKYINESKKSADIQQAQVIYDAIMTQYADDAVNDTTIVVDNSGKKIDNDLSKLLKISNTAPTSKVRNDNFYYDCTVDATTGTVTVTVYAGGTTADDQIAPSPADDWK